MHQILALWTHPRSLSTVLERVIIERGDFAVIHEPFSAVYYQHEQKALAAHAQLSASLPTDYVSVRDRILRAAEDGPVCFKDMCYHCSEHLVDDLKFLRRTTNVFLVRDPKPTIASHFAMNPEVTLDEIGYEKQEEIFQLVTRITGNIPFVLSAEDLQRNAAGTLRSLWRNVGVDDRPDALEWQEGHRPEWDTWKAWHTEAAASKRIEQRRTVYRHTVDNHSKLAEFYRHHRPFHEELQQHCG